MHNKTPVFLGDGQNLNTETDATSATKHVHLFSLAMQSSKQNSISLVIMQDIEGTHLCGGFQLICPSNLNLAKCF
jgi:hypothetical protein